MDVLSRHIISFTISKGLNPDCFYGVPEGASKLGIICQFKWARQAPNFKAGSHALPMGRGKVKEHGMLKDRVFLSEPRGRVIILEDVTTTGGSLIDTIEAIKDTPDMQIVAAIGLTNRGEKRADGRSVSEYIKTEYGIQYHSMSEAVDLMPHMFQKHNPSDDIKQSIIADFNNHGERPLALANITL